MLRNQIVPAIREVVPENNFHNIWFQQDGCPAHNTREVRDFLSNVFGNNVISNSGSVPWPARSPDITPLDFYLWGFIKNEVYQFDPPENVNVLEERVRNVLASINNHTLRRVTNTVFKKC